MKAVTQGQYLRIIFASIRRRVGGLAANFALETEQYWSNKVRCCVIMQMFFEPTRLMSMLMLYKRGFLFYFLGEIVLEQRTTSTKRRCWIKARHKNFENGTFVETHSNYSWAFRFQSFMTNSELHLCGYKYPSKMMFFKKFVRLLGVKLTSIS